EIAKVLVPCHWWFSRWRWQSAPRSVVRAAPDILGKLLPAMAPTAVGKRPARSYAGPMDNAGVVEAMPTVGDRDDIGLITDYQAEYLLDGSPESLASVLAWGEAAG